MTAAPAMQYTLEVDQPSVATRRKVLVCRERVLPLSETFIKQQIQAYSRWQPLLVGMQQVAGLPLHELSTCLLYEQNNGWFAKTWRNVLRTFYRVPSTAIKTLRAQHAALVHVHFGPDAVEYWPALAKLGLPVVITLHGYDINRHKASWQRSYTSRWNRRYPARLLAIAQHPSVHFIAVSEAIKQRAIDYGIAAQRISVRYIGIDTQRFYPAGQSIVQRVRRIVFVGRMVEKKGGEYLLRAFARVKQVVVDAELVMIGGGPLQASLQALATQLALPVSFLGALSSDVVKQHLDAARIFCLPSVTAHDGDAEGLGLVLLEAQSCGVPVVTSARGGAAEGMIDGVTGFAFAERDESTLSTHLIRLLQDDALLQSMSIAARQFVVDQFDVHRCTYQLEALYDELA